MARDILDSLTSALGYAQSPGFVPAQAFTGLKRHRFHLCQAAQRMGAVGVFGLGDPHTSNYVPTVLIARASDEDEARSIHRSAWSQGLCPFLLIGVPTGVFVCSGFSFDARKWGVGCFVPSSVLSDPGLPVPNLLVDLTATRLRTSLAWRDSLVPVEERVDEAILADLGRAGAALINGSPDLPRLTPTQANGLIGRLLYLHFLIGRDILEPSWLASLGLNLNSPDRGPVWQPEWLWDVFTRLDSILNGSIFPISEEDRSNITASHIELVRGVIGYNDQVNGQSSQLGLFRVDLSVIRTETLSAIYEQFLSRNNIDPDDGTDAAFYTPPFLVDYVLNEAEISRPLNPGTRVLDGSAGSGVFLVAVYRRIIEKILPSGDSYLPHAILIQLMRDSIFAIERNNDACHITAFSLYLTMLDYMAPSEIKIVTNGDSTAIRLFPSLVSPVGCNILQRDLFDRSSLPAAFPRRFDMIVGNPPWGPLSKMRQPALAREFSERVKKTHHVGDEQIADLFFWRLTRWYLKSDGIAALVMPAKSFINQRSKQFVATIGRKLVFIGLANLSHMRRRLFKSAIHPSVVVFVARDLSKRSLGTRIHSPNLATQPVGRDRWLWTLTTDESAVEVIREAPASDPDRFLHNVFVRRSVDRRIATYLDDMVRSGQFHKIRDLSRFGLVWKSGDMKRRTGLADNIHLSSNVNSPAYINKHLVKRADGYWYAREVSEINGNNRLVPLSKSLLEDTRESFKQFFAGNIVAVPRSLEQSYRIAEPSAFNSSFNMFALSEGKEQSKPILDGLAFYIESPIFKYLAALNSRQMMIDRWVIELSSMLDLTFPFVSPEDPALKTYLSSDYEDRNNIIKDRFKLTSDYWDVINEFFDERQGFSNGNVPSSALVKPRASDFHSYETMLLNRLRASLGTASVNTERFLFDTEDVVATQITTEWSQSEPEGVYRAFTAYNSVGADVFTRSVFVYHDRSSDALYMIKPNQRLYWTREHAFSDAEAIDEALMMHVG